MTTITVEAAESTAEDRQAQRMVAREQHTEGRRDPLQRASPRNVPMTALALASAAGNRK